MVQGAAYYPDYLKDQNRIYGTEGFTRFESAKDRIKRDLDRMNALGFKFIRIGEFSWSYVEPSPGVFVSDLFEITLEEAASRHISVIFCTPTATPPKWLSDRYPEILIVNREGRTIPFGGRRHCDPLSRRYLDESIRITTQFARLFGQHRAVVGWQIDNEFGHHTSSRSYSSDARLQFQSWLKERYGSIKTLNEHYFNCFWSMNYRDFSEVDPPWTCFNPPNPHIELDYIRFMTFAYRNFQKKQIDVIRELCPQAWITHNLIPNFDELCLWEMTHDLDVVGYDHYQTKPLPDPINSALQFTLMKSLKQGQKFLVLEQQPLQVNWQKHNRRFSPDWIFLWGMQAALSGAEALLYFSWQRFYGGAEQYHDGIRSHDVRISKTPTEKVIAAQSEFFKVMAQELRITQMGHVTTKVLVVLHFESLWAHSILPQTDKFAFWPLIQDWLEPLLQSGVGIMFVPHLRAAAETLDKERLKNPKEKILSIFLGCYAFELDDQERTIIREFMDGGGHVVSMPRTAVKTKDNSMSALPLWIFSEHDLCLLDHGAVSDDEDDEILLESFSSAPATRHEFHERATIKPRIWAERIQLLNPTAWEVKAQFTKGLYKNYPALLQKKSASGGCYTHFAFFPEKGDVGDGLLWKALGLKEGTHRERAPQTPNLLTYDWNDEQHVRCFAAINFGTSEALLTVDSNCWEGRYLLGHITQYEQLSYQILEGLSTLQDPGVPLTIRLPGRRVLIGRPRGT